MCVCCSANVGEDVRVSVEGVGRGCEGECGFQFLAASNRTISVDRCVCVCMHACVCA